MRLCFSAAVFSTAVFSAVLGAAEFKSGSHAIAYEIAPAKKQLTLIANTAYDPKELEGDSVYTVAWSDKTAFVLRNPNIDLKSLKPGTVGKFYLTKGDAAKARRGETFRCSRVEIPFAPGRPGFRSPQILFAPIFPLPGGGAEIAFGDRRVRCVCGTKVIVLTPGKLKDIQIGASYLRVWGQSSQGKFTATTIVITQRPDRHANDDPKLPNVLVAGDSISMNYHNAAKAALKGKFNYHRIEENSGDSSRGASSLRLWLGDRRLPGNRWAVVVLNHGLHDLRQPCDTEIKAFLDKHQVEPADYARNIDRELKYLTDNKYAVVWCTTTPVPNNSYGASFGRRKDEDKRYNAVLEPVLKKYPMVVVCDLNALVRSSKVFDQWRKGDNVHFRVGPEQDTLGRAVAESVRKAAGR